jgi:branched-subunit amino acid transport protein
MAALVVSLLTTPNGELVAGVPEIVGLVGTAIVAKVSGNHILALLTGMTTFWLVGWIV